MFRNECSDAKKNTQFFHGISTMRFLDHPILLMLQKQFHPGFWLTFPSIFQSPFSHPIAGYVFFSMSMVRIRNRWELGVLPIFQNGVAATLALATPRQTETSFTSWQRVEDALDSTEVEGAKVTPEADGDGLMVKKNMEKQGENVLKAYPLVI